jgi:Restriction Enzyme Adenine Methylase Associated
VQQALSLRWCAARCRASHATQSALAVQADMASEEEAPDRPGGKAYGTSVTLQDLISAGLLQPGRGVLTVTNKGLEWHGDLLEDGTLQAHGQACMTLTQFALAMIRADHPTANLATKNGWKAVSYNGRCACKSPASRAALATAALAGTGLQPR